MAMAAIIVRTATDEIADALSALDEVLRFVALTREHLQAALAQPEPLPGTLDGARHNAAIAVAAAGRAHKLIGAARAAVEPRD